MLLSLCLHHHPNGGSQPPLQAFWGPISSKWAYLDFPGGSDVKRLPAVRETGVRSGDRGSIPGLGISPGEGNGNPLQYFCLENPMDRGAWWATVHGVAKSRTRLSDFTFKAVNEVIVIQSFSELLLWIFAQFAIFKTLSKKQTNKTTTTTTTNTVYVEDEISGGNFTKDPLSLLSAWRFTMDFVLLMNYLI